MSKRILVSATVLLAVLAGCATGTGEVYQRNDLRLPMADIRNAWLEELDRSNPELHDTILIALVLSRQAGREVFVHKRTVGEGEAAQVFYGTSMERGGSENLMSVNYATREFLLDHFTPADGPTLQAMREQLFAKERIRAIKRDLGIFGIK